MSSRNKRICVFGDSHFACTKLGVDQGLVDTTGVEVEFWGNIGKQFRHLTWQNEQVEALDDFTAGRFAKTNSNGRRVLNAEGLDMIFFMGCRIDVCRLFPEALYRRQTPERRLSPGVEARWIGDFIRRQPPYQFARNFAAQDHAQILVAPVSFDTDGFDDAIPQEFDTARQAQTADRQALWQIVGSIMKQDGMALLPQPEETVTSGCFTHPQYAVEKHRERNDKTHKNSTYGALILNEALNRLRVA